MGFLHRLKYYLIGVGIGILVVLAIFKDRKLTSWTPKNQVLKEIADKSLTTNELSACKLNCLRLELSELKRMIAEGDVEFSKSDVRGKARKYLIEIENRQINSVEVEMLEESVLLKNIDFDLVDCNCP